MERKIPELPNVEVREMVIPGLIPELPGSKEAKCRITLRLDNTGLLPIQYKKISDNNIKEVHINYNGDFQHLDILMEQLKNLYDKEILLNIGHVDIDDKISLPFHYLSTNVKINFADSPERSSNFNNYIINTYDELYKYIVPLLDDNTANRITKERQIQKEFLKDLKELIALRGKYIDSYSKTELMNVIFNYICHNYPYDSSITGPGGIWTPESEEKGGTALATYERGKGVCTGRSKLIKLYANNRELKIPCYLVGGKYGKLGHMWNEYIDENGNIIEYDASFLNKCRLEKLPDIYKIKCHEPEVVKHLK